MSTPANEEILPVLKASVHDVRHFSSLLRGVNFAQRATVTITERGLVVAVEEARTLLATAYIFSDVFDEFEYHSESMEVPSSQENETLQDAEETYISAFEIQLNTLIECLNIFGTAGGSGSSGGGKHVQWKQGGEDREPDSDGDRNADANGRTKGNKKNNGQAGNTTLDQFFNTSERKTSMRMSYLGSGFPLTMLIAEDSSGPTTTCEISTFEAEPQLELPFDNDNLRLKVILKSSWLKEALSEIDPSCDKITFIGNPIEEPTRAGPRERARTRTKPILRIQATSTHGTTEMEYYNDKDVLESFECVGADPVIFSYRFSHITRAMRALQTSIKTSLRIDQDGLLSLQFLMPAQGSRRNGAGAVHSSNFIEFRCLALDEDTM